MDLLEALKHSGYVIHSSEIVCRSFGDWTETLDKGTLRKIEEMEGGEEMTLTINSEFSVLIEDLIMLHSDVLKVNAIGEEES